MTAEELLEAAQEKSAQKDEIGAFKLILEAANLGSPEGTFEAAERFFWGIGCAENQALATDWYRKAAEGGHIGAATSLGICYLYGDGVPKNLELARHFLEIGVDSEDEEAEDAMEVLIEEEKAKAKRDAVKAKTAAKKARK